jgi:hypothetical protein
MKIQETFRHHIRKKKKKMKYMVAKMIHMNREKKIMKTYSKTQLCFSFFVNIN